MQHFYKRVPYIIETTSDGWHFITRASDGVAIGRFRREEKLVREITSEPADPNDPEQSELVIDIAYEFLKP